MASILREKNGRKAIQIVCDDGKRRTIRLGKVTMDNATEAKKQIEAIAAAKWSGDSLPLKNASWLAEISDTLHKRIASAGFASPRINTADQLHPIGKFVDDYIESRLKWKASTKEQYGYTKRFLIEFFGADKPIEHITEANAEDWKDWLDTYELKPASDDQPARIIAPATASKHTKRAKTIFARALKETLIPSNPLDAIKGGNEINRSRDYFVDRAVAEKCISASTGPVYKLAFALARYGGLRACELLAVTWDDMLWSENKIRVDSPKTGLRFVPMFGELRSYLDDAYHVAPGGQVRCLERFQPNANLGPQITRFVEQAGCVPWKKPLQNLRASRRTELEELFPTHVVNAWMGHSTRVAQESYLQVTPMHWEMASRKSDAESDAVEGGIGRNTPTDAVC